MKTAGRRGSIIVGVVAVLVGVLVTVGSSSATAQTFGYSSLNDIQKRHVSGLLATELGVQRRGQIRRTPSIHGHGSAAAGAERLRRAAGRQRQGEPELPEHSPIPTCRAAASRRMNRGWRPTRTAPPI